MVETGDRNAADVVVVQRAGREGWREGWREDGTKGWREKERHFIVKTIRQQDKDRYSQHLQRPQSPERTLLDAADVVFIQLTGGDKFKKV